MRKVYGFLLIMIAVTLANGKAVRAATQNATRATPETVADSPVVENTRAGRKLPNISFGLGGYFREPNEVTNAASHSAIISGRPMLTFRAEQSIPRLLGSDAWVFEPHIGLVLPQISREKMAALTAIFNFDLGYLLTESFVLSTGIGVNPTMQISSGRSLDVGGEFVTPSGTALSWLFTNNFGVGYWLEPHLRLDGGTSVVRLFDSASRRFRYFIEVAYAF